MDLVNYEKQYYEKQYYEKQGKRRRCNSQEDRLPSGMERLPREIVLDILSRLPITSLVQFKFVCRAWRMLAQDPQLANMHLSRTAKSNPCLIFHCDYPIRNQLYFVDISDDHNGGGDEEPTVKKICMPFWDVMPEFDVVGSCNGLLCLSDSLYSDALYIYNPFTRDYKELPKSMQYSDQEVVFGFGFHPTTKEYKVVRIVYYRNGYSGFPRVRRLNYPQSDAQVFTLGSPKWRSLGKVSYQLDRRPSEALVNGRLHWVTRRRRFHGARGRMIVSFDLADEQFREVPRPDSGGLYRCNYHLLVLGECLSAAVYCNNGKLEIWVMKDYNVKESWMKEFNIGAYVPKGLKQNVDRSFRIWKSALNGRVVRILCLMKNGEILLEYKSRVLVSYDPGCGKFKDLMFQGIPNWFQTVVHVGSLNWIDTPIDV